MITKTQGILGHLVLDTALSQLGEIPRADNYIGEGVIWRPNNSLEIKLITKPSHRNNVNYADYEGYIPPAGSTILFSIRHPSHKNQDIKLVIPYTASRTANVDVIQEFRDACATVSNR